MTAPLREGRAAVFVGAGKPLELRRFSAAALQPGEALVRVACSSLCGSDLHTFAGRRSAPTPCVLGHEMIGMVEELAGPLCDLSGRVLQPGDRVVWSVAASCGDCFYCARDLPQKCERLHKYGHSSLAAGGPFCGGLADYCLLRPGTPIVRLPDELTDEVACPAGCATATICEALGSQPLETVAVLGLGPLGLTACARAAHLGAKTIIGLDLASELFPLAIRFGATAVCAAGDGALAEALVREQTSGRGCDLVVEVSGSPLALELALRLARIGGRIAAVGAVLPTQPAALDPERIVRGLLTIQGVHNYRPASLLAAVNFLAASNETVPWRELAGPGFALDEVNAAFDAASRLRGKRVFVRP